MACSSWWCMMAKLSGVVAGVAMVLTVVPSSGRRARRKWSNLVVFWQVEGGKRGGGEKNLEVGE